MEHTCNYCEKTKTEAQMAVRGGKPSKQCLECKQSRASLGAGAPKKKRAKSADSELELTLPVGGFGIVATVTDEGYLQLSQANDDAEPDNICITKHEARALFEKFGEWAAES